MVGTAPPFQVADRQLDVLPTGATMARRLPGRQSGLNEGTDSTGRDGFDQPTKGRGQHEWPLPLRPGVAAFLWDPDQHFDVRTEQRVQTGRPGVGCVEGLADQLTDKVKAD
eukprot:15470017-Alexandrium_andersonii.AAC.1